MTTAAEPKLSALLHAFVEADPSQLERGETADEWVGSMYLKRNSIAKLKQIALEVLAEFEDHPSAQAASICAMIRPLTE